jgi:rhodanese-related sulfurtransferase
MYYLEFQDNFILIDCRTPKELEKAGLNAPQTVSIPLEKLRERLYELDPHKETHNPMQDRTTQLRGL